jgi:predicted AlkP superfamily phosphohydrolase/phosphomutase
VSAVSRPSTLVVGWDGATPQLLFPWIDAGELPVLARLREGALSGPLRSVQPPMTLPAWSSFLTGVGPGEHGIVDFALREAGTGRLRFLDARDRAVDTVPERLDRAGWRVGTALFPTTWPPVPLSGGQISGFDSPVATTVPRSACAPPELADLIQQTLGRPLSFASVAELRKGRGWEEEAAAALLRGVEDKERVSLALLDRGAPLDFFAVLFGESDTASHHFWHLCDPRSPRHDPEGARRFADVIRAVYRRLDQALGALLDAAPWRCVVLASDHGFGPASDRVLHLNAWLASRGFLRWRGGPPLGEARHAVARMLPAAVLDGVARRLPRRLVEEVEGRARWGRIDPAGTDVFSDELNYAPSLRLNLQGRDPGGRVTGSPVSRAALVERLERALLDWRDPFSGRRIVRALVPRERWMPGPCADRAPDFFLDLEEVDGATWNVLPSRPGDPAAAWLPRRRWRGAKGMGMSGSHRRDGVFLLQTPGTTPGTMTLGIEELLPRWARDAGVDLPPAAPAGGGAPPSNEAPGQLADRLRRLGYLP